MLLILAALALGMAATWVPAALAQTAEVEAEPTVIFIVDMERVRKQSAAGIGVVRQTEAYREAVRLEMTRRTEEIRSAERTLADERDELAPDVFRARVRAFERRVAESQEYAQTETKRLQAAIARAGKRLVDAATLVLADIMRERGGELLLDATQIVLSADELDITEEAIARLDEAVPNIPLDLPEIAEE